MVCPKSTCPVDALIGHLGKHLRGARLQHKMILKVAGAIAGIAAAIFVVAIGMAIFTGKLARPISWRFPQGYRGWVVMEFQDPHCSPMAIEDFYLIVSVSGSGRGCTSSPIPEGWRYTRYEYIDEQGSHTKLAANGWNTNSMIWPISINRAKREWYLFVGTQEELNRSWKSRPD